ncbi:acetolactate synthase, large subunit, biosynthetic type [Trichophyton rubrum D6]|uniref:Acetolactate synthase n=5 Tax=Trichophyton TaxID=5550 RepID=A0A178EU00_TRIRU|nr:acetolactate synthase, large subunit, biosynthetic type [Trichophyton rubrum MR850]EZF37971.1 acetolactate synthase, large subunit, biosynthetic type [Trichophyton rubrum CBS 100081]EZF48606.1 acetolactate synthase, large subunit, biosynthetic type [Trichophyton rubrum CBS 288.86]EZF59293.1 acetolactate synthase, large subunit, biosynthetic type [Trichophyton rubrum CBS 289.86]EZF69860.1 acetolactate synthase, large subunit, biosynthetic type [Trichophyton soudanense CBS 452.61]EZF80631.1 a
MMMLSASRASRSALRTANCLSHTSQASRRQFSATAVASALSPHRRPSQRASTLDTSKRGQSTATASSPQARPVPSPAFNQDADRHDISPLHRRHAPALDDSFVGLSGGQIFHEMMLRLGVKHIFGYPGGAILPVFDAIYNSTHFDFVLPRHEQGAGHMAEGYARATGKPGVVLVTSGPGATNVITPMQDALSDGTPMVVFCGQVPTTSIGTDAFQEADVIGISRACTKWNVMVKNVAELPRRIKEAFEIATSGRPGPVLVDLPKDVTGGILRKAIPMTSSIPAHPSAASIAARELSRQQLEASIQRVAKLVNVSKKPVLYVGQGLSARPEGPALLKELADKANIPVTTTLQGLGGFDELDPKSLHMLGMHGSAYANMAMQEADLIIALGARFDDRVTGNIAKFAPQAKAAALEGRGGIVHFEVIPKNINKVVEATEAVEGDCADNLAILLPHVNPVAERPEWFAQINDWKARFPLSAYDRQTANGLIKPQAVIETLSELTAHRKDKTVITTGVGQHQMWAAQHFRWRHPRSMITSGGLGTMGYGLPSAIGAKVARPDALVIDIDGDASFNMTLTELSTAAQFNIDVKVIVLNNEEQGMVTQWQSLFYEDRFAHTHQKNPDFVKVSEAMGVQARRCLTPDQVESSLQWLINSEGPALLEIATDKKVPVLPMVPAGKALHEFLVYDEAKEKERRALMKKRSGH